MKSFFSLLIIIATLVSYFFYKDKITTFFIDLLGQNSAEKLKHPIASLMTFDNNVKYKRATKLVWDKAKQKMQFEEQDSISTSEKSSAVVNFFVGTMMNINENSLVVIETPEIAEDIKATQLNLEDGILQIRNTKENNITIVKSGNLTTTARGVASFGLKVKNKKAEVWVDEGQATVSDKTGKTVLIKKDEYKVFDTNAIKEEPVSVPKKVRRKPRLMTIKTVYKKSLSTGTIRTILAKQRNKIDRCYQKRGILNVRGIVYVQFTIQNTGVVSNVKILNSTVKNAVVDRCVKLWIKASKFPKFEDKKQVTESIRFVFN